MSGPRAGSDGIADLGGLGIGDDRTAELIIGFLRSEGAARLAHTRGSTLLDHLVGTSAIVRRWKQPVWLQHAALIHSVYGTDVYHRQLLALSRREDLIGLAGGQAERLAYLFCVTDRDSLLAAPQAVARGPRASDRAGTAAAPEQGAATPDEVDALVLLHMANLAEQVQARDGSPGRWLVTLAELAEPLIDSNAVRLPLFIAGLAAFSEADESLTRRAYLDGIGLGDEPDASASRLALAAAVCPVVPEPCVWQAYLSRRRGDLPSARWWAASARKRLLELGTVWDKRLTFEEWLELIEAFERPPNSESPASIGTIMHPRVLFETTAREPVEAASRVGSSIFAGQRGATPDSAAGRQRYHRYIETFAGADGSVAGMIYPDLPSQPWHNPPGFPLVSYLESHYAAIREEILAVEPSRFHRESERIMRSGDWDVAFLYERGRRHDEMCDACPVTTRGIEAYPAVRTVAGLIYVSRMRASTHIAAHRGPTNLRLRCHLGIKVPEGDCGIRVGGHTRSWQEGKCLVFDDYFEHEAWNHTDEDRIVLIVDIWHPGLSDTEVRLLEGLHNYTYAHARKLSRYWSANAAAGREAGDG
jgi:aspartate beta-hydroxylase